MSVMDIAKIREQFPILSRQVSGRSLIYFDNAATSQTPARVVDAIVDVYTSHKANVHRGVHTLSQEATDMQEHTRRRVAQYINARSHREVIFTRGTTEGINLVASSFGSLLPDGGDIILTVMEHHANIVPWQLLAEKKNMHLRVVDIDERGELKMDQYRDLFGPNTAMVAFAHVSNVLGTVNPAKEMVAISHSHGVPVLVDGAQAAPHIHVDVQDIDADFYVFSSHKMYGPAGIGVLYGKEELLEKMPPYQGGGEMIEHVSFEHTTYAELPFKFEAGTPDFVDIAALSRALDFIEETGIERIAEHEHELLDIATAEMLKIPELTIYGMAEKKDPVISFNVGNIHNYDVGMLLDKQGVAVRTGHHCAQPLMKRLGVPGTVRASFAVYNTREEVEAFITALNRALDILR